MKLFKPGRADSRRRGVAGVLAALLVFALIFSVGSVFFLDISSVGHSADQAQATRNALLHQADLENLSLKAELLSGYVWLEVNNTGSASSSIVSVFVTSPSGELISDAQGSPQSHYLSKPPDLSLTLPLSLPPGVSTNAESGCAPANNCDIDISSSSLNSSYFVAAPSFLVSVLTSVGNVFSVQYPQASPSEVTLKNINYVNETLSGQSLVNVVNQSLIIGCDGCYTDLSAGGQILVAEITATPSPVSVGGTISVTATVWDYSTYNASNVAVTLYAATSGGASVTPSPSQSSPMNCPTPATPETIPAGKYVTFSPCYFTANLNSGSSIGAVTFIGFASGSVTLPSGSTQTVTSGTTSSNPVQVGTSTFGVFLLNYYYFGFTGCTGSSKCSGTQSCISQTPLCSAAVISHAETYAAFYVQVTNTGSSPVSILDGSYLQFVSPGTDIDEYAAESPCYTGSCASSPSFSAYGCFGTPGASLSDSVTGQSCITVNQGQTVTLVFAACSPAYGSGGTASTCSSDSSSASPGWTWGTGNPGGDTGVGEVVQIILEYAVTKSGVVSSIGAQDIPFQAVFIS